MTVIGRVHGAGCGCSSAEGDPPLVGIDAALALIRATAGPVPGTDRVPLAEAQGRVLAAPILARGPLPPFDNAAMDGYAVATAGLAGDGPWQLDLCGRAAAGAAPPPLARPDGAIRIFTGAPVPAGADAVVMQEEVRRAGHLVHLRRRPAPGEHIRRAGEEMAAGSPVLPAGRTLGIRDVAACAAAGHGSVEVRRRVRVALVTTGTEVAAPGEPRGEALIWDANTPMLRAALTLPAVDLVSVRHCGDSPGDIRGALAQAAAGADLVVTTGGLSVGDEDHVKPALRRLGAGIVFSGVAVKPGKPVSFGRIGAACWLGLPGNPVSAFLTWTLFGTALLGALAGDGGPPLPRRRVVTAGPAHLKAGRCELRPARLVGCDRDGREIAAFGPSFGSARVASLAMADGILLLPAHAGRLPEGAVVDFLPFPTG